MWLDQFTKAWLIATTNGQIPINIDCKPKWDTTGPGTIQAIFIKIPIMLSALALFATAWF